MDQTSESGSVVHRLSEEMRLMERLIPCDNIELRDCIGQGELTILVFQCRCSVNTILY